ncbi:uncharacterized protein LOC115742235 [Rhodamnia argentea]|uniref:Uncharacterized protein LOC115742235 n=1 Tax=Rhodamnia argentea TaxID=178133 RepID=A0A8B8PBQ8_9MYRT|nr:uncharacterized protein LOC115742235 [Rhodamnia argentea]
MKMDVLGVHLHHQKKIASSRKPAGAARRRSLADKGIKVVYISSPMKVKTSAAEFRATVQGLTGRDSDVARLMDADGDKPRGGCADERGFVAAGDYCVAGNSSSVGNNNCGFGISSHNSSSCESPAESDTVFEQFEAGSVHGGGERGMAFPSNYFHESAFLDVLSCFDTMA